MDLKHFRIDQSMEIESLDDINAITMTAENGVYALGCSKGLYIIKQLSINSKHFDYKNIISIAFSLYSPAKYFYDSGIFLIEISI